MSKDSLNDWSTTPADNTDIAGTNINVGCPPQDVGVYMRTAMAQIAYAVQGSGGAIPETWNVGTLIAAVGTIAGALTVAAHGTAASEVVNYSQFAPNVAADGHIKLPGGLILNWGIATTGSGGATAVGFDAGYSSTCYAVTATSLSSGYSISADVASTSSFNATSFNSGGLVGEISFYWMAIGE